MRTMMEAPPAAAPAMASDTQELRAFAAAAPQATIAQAQIESGGAAITYRVAHPMDNTSGTIALRRRMVRAYTRRALESLLAA